MTLLWRSVFLHEFLDQDLRNFQAIAGSPTSASLSLPVLANSPIEGNSVLLTPGRGFEYSFAEPLDEVIGVSGRVRLHYPMQGAGGVVQIMRVGDMAGLEIWPSADSVSIPFLPDRLVHRATVLLRIGATHTELGVIVLPHRQFVDLRFDWHTSGQVRLLLNGGLAGYHNAVAPNAQLEVAGIRFGLGGLPSSATNPRYQIARVFVRILRRADSVAAFEGLLAPVDVPEDDRFERCRWLALRNLLMTVDRLRQFMTMVNQNLSQPWSEQGGPADGPFTPEAKDMHELAVKAVAELGRMLRTGDFSTPDAFLKPITQFLVIIHEAFPDEFAALAGELLDRPAVTDECAEVLALEEGRLAFAPVVDLLLETSRRIRELAAVN